MALNDNVGQGRPEKPEWKSDLAGAKGGEVGLWAKVTRPNRGLDTSDNPTQ